MAAPLMVRPDTDATVSQIAIRMPSDGLILIRDPKSAEALRPLDRDGDGAIGPDDFDGASDAEKLRAMAEGVADAYFPPVDEASGRRNGGFKRFVSVAAQIRRAIVALDERVTSTSGALDATRGTLEFSFDDWPKAKALFTGSGVLAPQEVTRLSKELYAVVHLLGGQRGDVRGIIGSTCDGRINGFSYAEQSIPTDLLPDVNEMIDSYAGIARFFDQVGAVECDGRGVLWWDDCPFWGDGVPLAGAALMSTIQPSTVFLDFKDYACSDDGPSRGRGFQP